MLSKVNDPFLWPQDSGEWIIVIYPEWWFETLHHWLVVDLPLWKISSIGMMKFPYMEKSKTDEYEFVNWDDEIPNWMEQWICSKTPTRSCCIGRGYGILLGCSFVRLTRPQCPRATHTDIWGYLSHTWKLPWVSMAWGVSPCRKGKSLADCRKNYCIKFASKKL